MDNVQSITSKDLEAVLTARTNNADNVDHYTDASDKMSLAVQGAVKVPGATNNLYRASSSEHLPVLTFTQDGLKQSVKIDAGHTFSINTTNPKQPVVKQFDSTSGKLVSEDQVDGITVYHEVIDARTGKPTSATRFFSQTPGVVEHDLFDKNGVIQSGDTIGDGSDLHVQYDSQGKAKWSIQTTEQMGPDPKTVETTIYEKDGRQVVNDRYPGGKDPHTAHVIYPDGTGSSIFFDPKTDKPNEALRDDAGYGKHFIIDQTTGKASPDPVADVAASIDRWMSSLAQPRPKVTSDPIFDKAQSEGR